MLSDQNLVWYSKTPKYTSFRLNKLQRLDLDVLKLHLSKQKIGLNASTIPNYFLLAEDCLIVAQWPEDVEVDNSEHEIIVDPLCGAAVLRGSHVYAPAVMGLPSNCKVGDTVEIYADLEGKCKKGLKVQYLGKKKYLGKGLLNLARKDLFDEGGLTSGIAVYTLLPASKLPVVNESIFPIGSVVLQNLPSIVCGWVVDAHPNETILDMCAAPGNKTTHLAEMSDDKAFIIALDKTEQKASKIRENCEKHNLTCVKAFAYDSRRCCSEDSIDINNGPPFPSNSFDKVLLDGPCSGLGQRPQLVNKMTSKMQQSYKFMQRSLFSAATKVLKPGGILVYSTCTFCEDENEGIVEWALKEFPIMELVPAVPLKGGPGLAGCGLSDSQRSMVQRFGPDEDILREVEPIYRDTIGFFIAKFKKRS